MTTRSPASGDVLGNEAVEHRRGDHAGHRTGLDLWDANRLGAERSPLRVDRQGHIYIVALSAVTDAAGQGFIFDAEQLDLLGVFKVNGARGPDLRAPRAKVQIVPGKVAGEPHVAGTRITTAAPRCAAGATRLHSSVGCTRRSRSR